MKIAVTGSIATDHLMHFPGRFAEQLIAELFDELVCAEARLALAAIDERVVEGRLVLGVLPDEAVEDDGGVYALDVVALVDEPAPPRLFDVVAELDAEWTIVPRAAQSAIKFRGRKNKATPLGERNDSFDVRCRHEYRINRIPRISKSLRFRILLILKSC